MNIKKFQIITVLLSIFLILIPTYATDCTWLPEDIFNESFEDEILSRMADYHVNSLAFSVINGTEIFYSKGFGDQPGTDIAYHINSAGKMFTATAILQLYEQGLIGLDDDFNDYLPYELKNPYYPSTKITIGQILAHRASIVGTYTGWDSYWALLLNETCTFPSIIYEFLHENGSYYSEDNWEPWMPGTGSEYSDTGFDILTLILENITGIPFDDYCQENIFLPLGMTNTRHSADDYALDKIAIGYDWNITTETNEIKPYLNNSINPGGGGYFSTVEDVSKFMLAHLNHGTYNGVSILNATTIDLMHTDIAGSKWALGWQVRKLYGSHNDYQGHGGGPWTGFTAENYIRKTIGIILFVNQGSWDIPSFSSADGYGYVCDKANMLLTEKCPTTTTTDEGILYLLPTLICSGIFVAIFRLYKKKK